MIEIGNKLILKAADFQQLLDSLHTLGFQTIGPTVTDGTLTYAEINQTQDLPIHWQDKHEKGFFRLVPREDEAFFGFNLGAQSWKQFLHPPQQDLWQGEMSGEQPLFTNPKQTTPKYAFIGVRACELQALFIQDNVFIHNKYVDQNYLNRRENTFIVAVNCAQASETCFCVSMNSGPQVKAGFDLALTEFVEETNHFFLVEVGTDEGASVMAMVNYQPALAQDLQAAEAQVAAVSAQMNRQLELNQLKELLYQSYDDPHWDEIAQRCLACGNCTQVCPTCFCTSVEEVTDLDVTTATHQRKWDSCFNLNFSYIHGGSVRPSPKARYRQWLTHKLATWQDQFGTPGCVGCGRCITWCPVGIDLTEEVRVFQQTAAQKKEAKSNV